MRTLNFHKLFVQLITAVSLLGIVSCSEELNWKDTQIAVAKTAANVFMIAYYVDDNLSKASELSTGEANKNIRAELNSVEQSGEAQKLDEEQPVSYLLIETEAIENGKFTFTWKVKANEGNSLSSKLMLIKDGNEWLVSELAEEKFKE